MSTQRLVMLAVLASVPLAAVVLAIVTLPSRLDAPQAESESEPKACDSCTARHQGLSKDESTREQERALLKELYETSKGRQ